MKFYWLVAVCMFCSIACVTAEETVVAEFYAVAQTEIDTDQTKTFDFLEALQPDQRDALIERLSEDPDPRYKEIAIMALIMGESQDKAKADRALQIVIQLVKDGVDPGDLFFAIGHAPTVPGIELMAEYLTYLVEHRDEFDRATIDGFLCRTGGQSDDCDVTEEVLGHVRQMANVFREQAQGPAQVEQEGQ